MPKCVECKIFYYYFAVMNTWDPLTGEPEMRVTSLLSESSSGWEKVETVTAVRLHVKPVARIFATDIHC